MNDRLVTGAEGWVGEWEDAAGASGVSLIFNRSEVIGFGPRLHSHPYAETFIVRSGQVAFTLGKERYVARAGEIVVAPAGVPHRFENLGPEPLEMIDIHPSPRFVTTWLE